MIYTLNYRQIVDFSSNGGLELIKKTVIKTQIYESKYYKESYIHCVCLMFARNSPS